MPYWIALLEWTYPVVCYRQLSSRAQALRGVQRGIDLPVHSADRRPCMSSSRASLTLHVPGTMDAIHPATVQAEAWLAEQQVSFEAMHS